MARIDQVTRKWIRSKADEVAVESGCRFDLPAADRVRKFFANLLRHSKGDFAGKPFELLDWQWQDLVAPLFGWKRPDGTRRYRQADAWVPKKNGKSTLCAGLVLYGLCCDGEQGAEVYGAAADRTQGQIIYREVERMVSQSPALSAHLTLVSSRSRVVYPRTGSYYEVLSKDSKKTGHGINASLLVVDELHVVDRVLWNTIAYAKAARKQPLSIAISTAGNDVTSFGYERYREDKRILDGEVEPIPHRLILLYQADSNDVWEDPAQWEKANPSLGETITRESFEEDFDEAKKGSAGVQANFKQLRLNLWQDSVNAWLPVEEWDACANPRTDEELDGLPCTGGFDLASKLDLCAWCRAYRLESGKIYLRFRFWCPEEADNRRQRANKALLKPWIISGHITATPGNVTDYDAIEQAIKADHEAAPVEVIAFDPWNATQIVGHLQEEGLYLEEFAQTIKNFNEPMKEAERLILARGIEHDGNPVMRWQMGNVMARTDTNGNSRPDKAKSQDKIDGVVSMLMALAKALQAGDGSSHYDDNDVEMG